MGQGVIAGAMALRKCVAGASPQLLEPIMEVTVTAGDEYTGPILGDLTARRGKVLGMDKKGRKEVVRAYVPLGEIFNYATELRSLTRGTGRFTMVHGHYEDVPPDRAQPLIQDYQKAHAGSEA